ncbi:MAG: leucine-rich repeat protein, partial [Acutalibacteraceae bacterium]
MKKSKRIISILLVVFMLATSAPLQGFVGIELPKLSEFFSTKASAEDGEETEDSEALTDGYYTYTVTDGNATIVGCDESISGDVVIPDTLGGYPVTGIGEFAFFSPELTSATIPDCVTSIGMGAFASCDSLEKIYVSENNDYYSSVDGVLFNKDQTKIVIYPRGNHESEYVIPDGVTIIDCYAFYDCDNLLKVIMPDSITLIDESAFCDSENLTDVTFSDNITDIGYGAFWGCIALTSVTIPESVTSIGIAAFATCVSLEKIYVGENNKNYSSVDGVLFNKEHTELVTFPSGKTAESYVVPDSVTNIIAGAFLDCMGLISVTIPESVTNIGSSAFNSCIGLTSVKISDGVTRIGDSAFYNCSGLTSITIPESVTSIGAYAFNVCTSLEKIEIFNPSCEIYDETDTIPNSTVIYGYENSTAQQYAEKYSRTFELIHTHEYTSTVTTAATCTEAGVMTYTCSVCGDSYTEEIPDLGHSYEVCYLPTGECKYSVKCAHCSEEMNLDIDNCYYEVVAVSQNDTGGWNSAALELFAKTSGGDTVTIASKEGLYINFVDKLDDGGYGERVLLSGKANALPTSFTYSYNFGGGVFTWRNMKVSFYLRIGNTADVLVDIPLKIEGQSSSGTLKIEDQYVQAGSSSNTKAIGTLNISVKHNHTYPETGVVTAPTCTTGGYTTKICAFCTTTIKSNLTQKLGHDYVPEHFEKDGENDGYTLYTCSRCNDNYTVIDPAEKLETFVAYADIYKINLTWSKAVEASVTGYEIFRKAAEDDEFILLAKIDSRNTLSYVDDDLKAGENFSYKIRAMKDSVEGEFSDVVSETVLSDTEKPIVVSLEPSISNATYSKTMKISASAQDNIAVTKLELLVSTDSGETWTTEKTVYSSSVSYELDTMKFDDGILKFKAVAYDAEGNRSNDYIIRTFKIDNTAPQIVQGLAVSDFTTKSVLLTWNDVSDDDRRAFVLQRKDGDSYITLKSDITTIGYTVTNLKPSTDYEFRIAAVDACGNIGEYSQSVSVRTLDDTTAPVIAQLSPSPARFSGKIPFKATAKDEFGISEIAVQYSLDAVNWTEYSKQSYSSSNSSQTYSCEVSLPDFSEGSLYLRAVATDNYGNVSRSDSTAAYVEYMVDKTAPDAPDGLSAVGEDGYITIAWNQGKESDLSTYSVYRSENSDSDFECIASNLSSKSYNDTNTKQSTTYYYKICVCDTAGNISGFSETVSAQMGEDTQKPTVSISPADNSIAGPKAKTVGVYAADNNMLSEITVEYKVGALGSWQILSDETNINSTTKQLLLQLPIDAFNDNDTVFIKAVAVDAAGLESEIKTVSYSVDKSAPEINNAAISVVQNTANISWSDDNETDIKAFMIYYSKDSAEFKHIKTTRPSSEHSYNEAIDLSSLGDGNYIFKIESYDNAGNSCDIQLEQFSYTAVKTTKAPISDFSCLTEMEVTVQEYFDATASYDEDGSIVSYSWDFGDGTVSDKVRPVKSYATEGIYSVSLTVTDNDGLSSTVVKSVKVKNRDQFGTVDVKVVNSNNEPVSGISVKVDGNNALHRYTDSSGRAKIPVPVGEHAVSAYLDRKYLPSVKNVSVLSGKTTYVTITVIEGETIEGEFTVTELSLDEIKELQEQGFDIGSEENTQYYKSSVIVSYGETPVEITTNYSNTGTVINWDYKLPDINTSGENKPDNPSITQPTTPYVPTDVKVWQDSAGNEYIGVMAISAETKFFKELFNVRLDIFCNASSEFEVVDSMVTLNVPSGLSIIPGYDGYENDKIVGISSIKGGTDEPITLNWLVRGDEEGNYDLTADFFGTLSPINEVVTAEFKTQEPIKVYGTSAVKTIYDIADQVHNKKIFFNLGVENVSDKNVYYPDVQFSEETIDTFARIYNDANKTNKFNPNYINVYQNGMILVDSNGIITEIDKMPETLGPNEKVFRKYIAEGFDKYIYTEKFNEAIINDFSDGRTLNVEANILPVDSEVFKHEIDLAFVETDSISEVYSLAYRYDIGEKADMKIRVCWDNGFFEDYEGEADWSTDMPECASVNENGIVTMKQEGVAEITATLPDGIESVPYRIYIGEYSYDQYELDYNIDNGSKYLNINVNDNSWFKVSDFKVATKNNQVDCKDIFSSSFADLMDGQIVISKENYQNYIIPKAAVNSFSNENKYVISKTVCLEKDHKNSKPYISTVYARVNKRDSEDFVPQSYVEITKESLDYIVDDTVAIYVSAVGLTDPTYVISQDNNHKVTSDDGKFIGTMLNDFDTEKKTVVYAIDSTGVRTDAVEIKLKKQNVTPGMKSFLKNSTWNLLEDNKITIGNDIPIVGGSEISLDAFKLPVGIQITGNTVRVTFGFDIFDSGVADEDGSKWFNLKKDMKTASEQMEKAKDKLAKYQEYRQKIINNYNGKTIEPIKDDKKTFKVSVMGYAELSIANGQLVLADESFLSMGVNFKYTHNCQGAVWIIPAYTYVEAGLDVGCSGNIKRVVPDSLAPIEVQICLKLSPELRGGAGAGVKGYASAGASIGGKLNFENDFYNSHRYLDIEGDITVEGQLGPFKGEKKLLEGKTVVFDCYYGKAKSARSLSLNPTIYNSGDILLDEESTIVVESVSRDYAESTSDWLGSKADTARVAKKKSAESSDGVQMKTLQSGVYDQSQAKIISFGDKQLMTWIEDDTSRDEYNRQRLMFSVYDGVTWSTPKAVDDDGMNDMSPMLGTDGENVYVAWQKATRKFVASDAHNIDSVANSIEICVAKYNSESNEFENSVQVSNNNEYDFLPCVYVENGEYIVYWASGSGISDNYCIKKWQNGSQSDIKDQLGYVVNLAVGPDGEISYCCDTDSDVSTTDDISVFSINDGKETAFDNSDKKSFTQISYGFVDGKQIL